MTEFEIIKRVTKYSPKFSKDLKLGIGDDCAIMSSSATHDWLITTDALIQDVHFKHGWAKLEDIGYKALEVNISDIAAMGGKPRFYLVSIGLPPKDAAKIAEAIYKGMNASARRSKVLLIGGDTVASPKVVTISITAIGEIEKGYALLRNGARAGDAIYVTGIFGSSALGLAALKKKKKKFKSSIERHLRPRARVREGMAIAKSKMASAMIDASDGLLADLGHIAEESGVGFEIFENKVPVDKGFSRAAGILGECPVGLKLTGGEDYELIFTVKKSCVSKFERKMIKTGLLSAKRVGTMVANKRTRRVLDEHDREVKINRKGFDHFE